MVKNIPNIIASFQLKVDETLATIQDNKSLSTERYILEQAARDTLARYKSKSSNANK